MIVLKILAFIFAIGIIILIHEAGHFFCAKKAGILCHEFSIGFGPVIWQKRKGETMISIRALPIGGYVSMADSTMEQILIKDGEELGIVLEEGSVKELILDKKMDADVRGTVSRIELLGIHGEPLEVELETEDGIKTYPVLSDAFIVASPKDRMQITPYDRSFDSKKIPARLLTISAGVIMNFILAIVLYIIISFVTGVPTNSNEIGSVGSGYPSAEFLQEGDRITAINENSIESWDDLSNVMNSLAKQGETNLIVEYERNGIAQEPKACEAYIVLNSYGLSNIEISKEATKKPENNKGVQVGNLGLKYGTADEEMKVSDGEDYLKNGDYLLEVNLCKKDGSSVVEFGWQQINSWNDVISVLGNTKEVEWFYYKFYSQEKDSIIEAKTPIYSYSDALLNSQDIVKYKIYLGISPTYHFEFGGCLANAFKEFGSSSLVIFKTLKELVAPSSNVREVGLSDLSGVIGIFDMVSKTVSAGFLSYLSLIALLSVNIGIMNFLPIPALDGGRAIFLLYEAITHKKPNKKFENALNNIVFILLLILFVFVAYNDILRLFK